MKMTSCRAMSGALASFMCALLLSSTAIAQCPGSGDCCLVNETPGCDEESCCIVVCSNDPFCCVESWDEDCVLVAQMLCDCAAPPDADTCADATEILDGVTEFSNIGAQTDLPELSCGNAGTIGADIWFTYMPACSGALTVSTCDSVDYDSFLVAYSGTCTSLEQIACNDDGAGCSGFSSLMTVNVTDGEQILLRVGGWNGAEGTGTISITPSVACNCPGEGDCCAANGSVGCDDDGCCQTICAADPFCCTTEWDASCASAAGFLCGACGGAPETQPLALDYNWNGLVHGGEAGQPDAPDGYRSIGDRGLVIGEANSVGGLSGNVDGLLSYTLPMNADELDTMYLGGPRSAGGGEFGFDDIADGDQWGVAPSWDPSRGTSEIGFATSSVPSIPMNEAFAVGILYNASVSGGTFDLTLGFASGNEATVTIGAPDWFADFNAIAPPPQPGVAFIAVLPGPLSGGDGFESTSTTDAAASGEPLNVLEAVVTWGSLQEVGPAPVGETLTSLTIENIVPASNPNATVGVYAASVTSSGGGQPCPADVDGSGVVDVADLVEVILAWGACGEPCPQDVDDNGVVDVADLVEVILAWGPCA